jgi:hypothetical protein
MSVASETRVVRNPALVHTELDGFTMMMSVEAGKYFSLNPTGSRVWQLVEQPIPAGEVVAVLTREFEVDPDRCRQETLGLLDRLLAADLIRVVEETGGATPS